MTDNDKKAKAHSLFSKALDVVNKSSQFQSGWSFDLAKGKTRGKNGLVYLKNNNGFINMYVWIEGYTSSPFTLSHLSPAKGWCQSARATRKDFEMWHTSEVNKIDRLERLGKL